MVNELERLIDIVSKLHSSEGCPWDREQTHKSLLNCLLDETYEFFEAVDENSDYKMREELGDILLQVLTHSQIASKEKRFDLKDVAKEIGDKLIRRHPHVFGDVKATDSKEIISNWEKIKSKEKGKKDRKYIVDGIPDNLPALFKAEKLQRRLARAGFDWNDIGPVFDKVVEEIGEFREAVENNDIENSEEELGDILFALVNVARHKGICAEDALRMTVNKCATRFRLIEECLKKDNKLIDDTSPDEMNRIWDIVKKEEKHR